VKRTDPALWEAVKAEVTAQDKGGRPGQWSARKAQLAVFLYKKRGGGYLDPKDPTNSLARWTRQDWRTKSGRPSLVTGERYLPARAIEALTAQEYAATTKAKRAGMAKGQQFVKQPGRIAEKVKRFRRNSGPLPMEVTQGSVKKSFDGLCTYLMGGGDARKLPPILTALGRRRGDLELSTPEVEALIRWFHAHISGG
jgi:hypothetical protein